MANKDPALATLVRKLRASSTPKELVDRLAAASSYADAIKILSAELLLATAVAPRPTRWVEEARRAIHETAAAATRRSGTRDQSSQQQLGDENGAILKRWTEDLPEQLRPTAQEMIDAFGPDQWATWVALGKDAFTQDVAIAFSNHDGTTVPGDSLPPSTSDIPGLDTSIFAGLPGTDTGAKERPPIFTDAGKPPVYRPDPDVMKFFGGPDGIPEPIYRAGDQLGPGFVDLPPERIADLQDRLVRAGLLSEGEFTPGVYLDSAMATPKAVAALLGIANTMGTFWFNALNRLESNPLPEPKKLVAPFVAPQQIKPDYATLAETVRRAFNDAIGRDPTPPEISSFARFLEGQYEAAYQASYQSARAAYDASIAQDQATSPGGASVTITPESGASVDPYSRLLEAVRSRYADEKAFADARDNRAQNAALLRRSLSGITAEVK